tara:strand:- start:498 stop:881 length:384 start_codon:yes stop_codon:yes gene_type:complete
MGLFGGGNSKSSTEDNDITFNNVDYGESGGQGSKSNINLAVSGDGNTTTNNIMQTDFGAVMGGLDLAAKALDNITGLANSSAANNAALAEQASRTGDEKNIDGSVKLIGLALLGGSLFLYILKKGKG